MGRIEAGQPLWKRLAYVAITRAETQLRWIVKNRLAKPSGTLRTGDLKVEAVPLELAAQEDE
jgi:exodeoxyribonuclease-5